MADLKAQIIEQLNLQEVAPDSIGQRSAVCLQRRLKLDSIDALGPIVLLQQHYSIRIANPEEKDRRSFISVRTMAERVYYRKSNQVKA